MYQKYRLFLSTGYRENFQHKTDNIKLIILIFIKSNISYKDIYHPKTKTRIVSLDNVIRAIKKDGDIPINLKEDLIYAYDNIANKTKIKYTKDIYEKYVLDPIAQYYIDKDDKDDDNLLLNDESFKRELEDQLKDIIPETSVKKTEKDKSLKDKKDKSLKDKLKSDVSKNIINLQQDKDYILIGLK